MTGKNNSAEIKRRNKRTLLRQLIRTGEATKPELAAQLRISLPTVGQLISELIEAGLVEENGLVNSVGGRRPVSVRVVPRRWVALGADITAHHMGFALVDLDGTVINHERTEALFEKGDGYRRGFLERMAGFLTLNGLSQDALLGLGISLPGIISADQQMLTTSHALRIQEPERFMFRGQLPFPIQYFNDASAACMVECYADDAPASFSFLSLSNTVGGAMVIDKKIVLGAHNRSGELGHVCVVPGGRRCYCGQLGHYDSYGAAWLLAQEADGDLARFFVLVGEGDAQKRRVLDEYLDMLALLIYNNITFTDLPLIIGGYVGNYLEPYLPLLKQKVAEMDIFGLSDPDIRLCRRKEEAAATGCAQYFLERLIESL